MSISKDSSIYCQASNIISTWKTHQPDRQKAKSCDSVPRLPHMSTYSSTDDPKHVHFPHFLSVWFTYLWKISFPTTSSICERPFLQLVGGGRRPGTLRLSHGATARGGRSPGRLLRPVAAAGRSGLWAEFRQSRQPQGKGCLWKSSLWYRKVWQGKNVFDFPMEKLKGGDQFKGRHSWMENSLAIVL